MNDDEVQLVLFEGAEQKPKIPDAQREKRRWENRFQEWSNEQALSGLTHYGACGYGAICNYCDGDPKGRACVRALNEMLRTKRLTIDYKATTYEQAFDGQIGREAAS